MTGEAISLPWRTGGKVGRTIYVMAGDEPSDGDWLIGLMDSVELAREVVASHNARIAGQLPDG